MPELPEVETVRRGLNDLIAGETIKGVSVLWDNIIAYPEVDEFKEQLVGETFESVERRGKFLLLQLTTKTLVSHLRMEGKYQWAESGTEYTKHTHVVFHLESGYDLRYLDVRKFGRMQLVNRGTALDLKNLMKLGPEPTEEDFDLEVFYENLKRYKKNIKAVLLDQQTVAGLGNIYVDEVLFQSKIHPKRPANELTKAEVERLHTEIIEMMAKAIALGGTTIRTYTNAFGEDGTFQKELLVYGREGEECVRCGRKIEKEQIAQRGTHYCPYCQEEKV